MRLIHCADIHIGAGRADGREKDFALAFLHIAQLAIDHHADACLIAGDLFDRREINPRALSEATEVLLKLKEAGIAVYAIEGNHDKALYVDRESWMDYLDHQQLICLLRRPEGESLYVLKEDGGNVAFHDGLRIVGLPYAGTRTKELVQRLIEELPPYDGPTIAMLHCPVGAQMAMDNAYLPSNVVEALGEKVEYIALGHIHTAYSLSGIAFNPGAPESVRMDEAIGKEKGVYLVDVTADGCRAEHIAVNRRHSVRISVELNEEMDASAAHSAICDAMEKGATAGCLMSLIVTGSIAFSGDLLETERIRAYGKELQLGALDVQLRLSSVQGHKDVSMDMAALERQVIEELWNDRGMDGARLVDITLQLKERILYRDPDAIEEIALDVERLMEEELL